MPLVTGCFRSGLVHLFKSLSNTQEVPGVTEVRKGKSFKKKYLRLWSRLGCAGLTVGKALQELKKCCSGLACEMFHFLGTDGIPNPQLKTHSTPNQAPKFSGLFASAALSEFCVALF